MVRFRTTKLQWLGLCMIALVIIPGVLFGLLFYVGGQIEDGGPLARVMPFLRVIVTLYVLLMTLRIAIRVLRKGTKGIDADALGIRPTDRREAARFTPWPAIVDIRVRRSPLRRHVVLHTDRGGRWRLPVPYSGLLLAHDPAFSAKVETLRDMWRFHCPQPGAEVDRGPAAPRVAAAGPGGAVDPGGTFAGDGPAAPRVPSAPGGSLGPPGTYGRPGEYDPPGEYGPRGGYGPPVERGGRDDPYGPEGPAFRR